VRRSSAEALLARAYGLPSQSMDMRIQAVLAKRLNDDLSLDKLQVLE
jgi:hypothetical protein